MEGSIERILCSLLVAARPLGSALADAPKSKNGPQRLVIWWMWAYPATDGTVGRANER